MFDILLTVFCFSGFIYASSRWLKIDFPHAPVFSVSLIGILLFFFAASNYLYTGTRVLIYTGFFLSGVCGIDIFYNRKTIQACLPVQLFMVLVSLIVISYLIAFGMKFTVIDDYVYWGIMGKYLYLNHHLPDSNTAIIAKHLAYTPGTSLFHYFFYTLTGKYSPSTSYFAQNILLISALFVVLKRETIKKTILLLCVLVILLTLFSGSVFTKLQVDYLLSIYFFAVLWIYFNAKATPLTLATISLPACFLFLIKEIGLALCVILLIFLLFDSFFFKEPDRKTRIKSIVIVVFTFIFVFLLKQTWTRHCQAMGFLDFNTAVNMQSIQHALQIFSNENIRKGFFIFLKSMLFGPADRLNLPYILWYLALVFFWVKIFLKIRPGHKERYARLLKILSVSFVIYLIMLYFMQIIVFKVGTGYDHAIGMTRYLNIFFSQVVFFTILLCVKLYFFQNRILNKTLISFVVVILLILVSSRIETSLRREDHYKTAEQIAKKIEMNMDKTKKHLICIVPGTNDDHLGIKLLYHLLPNRVNHGRFPVKNKKKFFTTLLQYDYVLFNDPGNRVMAWITPLMDKSFESQGFFVIRPDKGFETEKNKDIKLEKIF